MMKRFKILAVILLLQFCSYAQSGDSLVLFKEFMQICNGYKQAPLHLSLEYIKSTNVILTGEDTTTMKADFYLLQDRSYIHFGELEQLIGDSLVLNIMHKEKQMLLSQKDERLIAQMKAMAGPLLQDTSLKKMAMRYVISKKLLNTGTAIIEIADRQKIPGTDLPPVLMQLIYNTVDKIPEKIITIKRSLLPKSAVNNTQTPEVKIITVSGKGDFGIKEDMVTYHYKEINHDPAIKLPVVITDRVGYDEEGNIIPIKAFESYTLIKN